MHMGVKTLKFKRNIIIVATSFSHPLYSQSWLLSSRIIDLTITPTNRKQFLLILLPPQVNQLTYAVFNSLDRQKPTSFCTQPFPLLLKRRNISTWKNFLQCRRIDRRIGNGRTSPPAQLPDSPPLPSLILSTSSVPDSKVSHIFSL